MAADEGFERRGLGHGGQPLTQPGVGKSSKVKRRSRHQKLPSDFEAASQSGLEHSACLLHPAERLFDQRPLALADLIPGMPRRAPINGAAAAAVHILRHMRPNVHFP